MVMEKALKMGESNACMRRIVAAPTAGSCGVIPAVFISYETYFKALEDDMVKALLIASGIGAVIAENASIAGALTMQEDGVSKLLKLDLEQVDATLVS